MTTTAEHIKNLEERLDFLKHELLLLKDSIEPPDPEPLECWVNVDGGYELRAYRTKERAEKANKHGCFEVEHFRQVTPQDEQNRRDAERWRKWVDYFDGGKTLEEMLRDAARYRYLKTATKGVLHWADGWLDGESTEEWNELIDKAMEEE